MTQVPRGRKQWGGALAWLYGHLGARVRSFSSFSHGAAGSHGARGCARRRGGARLPVRPPADILPQAAVSWAEAGGSDPRLNLHVAGPPESWAMAGAGTAPWPLGSGALGVRARQEALRSGAPSQRCVCPRARRARPSAQPSPCDVGPALHSGSGPDQDRAGHGRQREGMEDRVGSRGPGAPGSGPGFPPLPPGHQGSRE